MKNLFIAGFAIIALAIFAANQSDNHGGQSAVACGGCTNSVSGGTFACGGETNKVLACGGCTNRVSGSTLVCGGDTNKVFACGGTNTVFSILLALQ